jgi:hypothetical protein
MTESPTPDAAEPTAPESAAPDAALAPTACASCGTALPAGARFCQNCGTSSEYRIDDGLVHDEDSFQHEPLVTGGRGLSATLPWMLALAGVVGGSAYVANTSPAQQAAGGPPAGMVAPFAQGGGSGAPPDIASMTPNERANRLYGRIMSYVLAGKADSAAFFAPMALAAHEMLDAPSLDERYHLGQINEMIGNPGAARAQADSILAAEADNLLGLMLAIRAARMENKAADAKPFEQRLLAALDAQMATKRPEYDMHRTEIERAAADARTP